MDRGMTVTPEVGLNPDGSEYIADFNVATHNYSPNNSEQFYVEDNNGELVFDEEYYESLESEVEQFEGPDPEQDYVNALFEIFPNAMACLAMAADVYPREQVEAYNAALEVGDWDVVVPFLEQITNEFGDLTDQPVYSEDQDESDSDASDDWSPEETEQLEEAVDQLMDTTPDDYLADSYQEFALQAQDAGDEVMAAVAAATSAFHSGDLDANEAIDYILATYPKEEVIRVYQYLTQN